MLPGFKYVSLALQIQRWYDAFLIQVDSVGNMLYYQRDNIIYKRPVSKNGILCNVCTKISWFEDFYHHIDENSWWDQ